MLGLLSCALNRVIIELCQEKSSNHEKHGWNFYAKVVFLQPLLLFQNGLEPAFVVLNVGDVEVFVCLGQIQDTFDQSDDTHDSCADTAC